MSRYTFSELFSRAWVESMSMANILSGFRCTGIFPLDRSKLIHEESVDPDPTSNADNNVYSCSYSYASKKFTG